MYKLYDSAICLWKNCVTLEVAKSIGGEGFRGRSGLLLAREEIGEEDFVETASEVSQIESEDDIADEDCKVKNIQ